MFVTSDGIAASPGAPSLPLALLSGELFTAAWAAASTLLGLRLLAGILTLVRLRHRWAPQLLDGVPVLVSHDLGPAVVAWPRPAIVLPAWAVALPTAEGTLILLHEREHLRAGDAWLRLGASLITAAIPWNPVAWFLARRLATAIEVDCDARVLRAHPHRRRYAE
ncbi:MAG: M56 family metallopeptidase, partial [Gemmatimonadaceae bacterium]